MNASPADKRVSVADRAILDGAIRCNPEEIKMALARGGDPNARDLNMETPLYHVARFAEIGEHAPACVRLLLEAGADPNLSIKTETALVMAIDNGRTDLASILCKYGARSQVTADGASALGSAIGLENLKAISLLLKNGATPVECPYGLAKSCLEKAKQLGNKRVITLLEGALH